MPDSATILLVDDEDSIQKLLTYPLERDGYRVIQARDGEEALRRFEEEDARIDLVVLDLMLPHLDGLEVCKRLRAASTVPIIMLTARDDELDKVLGLELAPTTTSRSRSRSGSSAAGARTFARAATRTPSRPRGRADRARRPPRRPGRRTVQVRGTSARTSNSSCSPCWPAARAGVLRRAPPSGFVQRRLP